MKKVTVRDIAERAGVGKTAVSLALSDRYGVNEETKAKIMLTAYELGYDFSKVRRKSASLQKSIKLALRDKTLLTSRFWTSIIKGIEKEAARLGYPLEVFAFDRRMPVTNLYAEMLKNTSLGLIFVDSSLKEEYHMFSGLGLPIVLVDPKAYNGKGMTQVLSNNYLGGYQVGKYLWEYGHRRLAFLGNIDFGKSLRMRWLGFADAFAKLNRGGEGVLYALTDGVAEQPTYMHNEEQLLACFADVSARPTALFCGNDAVGIRAIEALSRVYGIRVPDDCSVVGFDNIEESLAHDPPLTTVNVDKEGIGRMAVKLLVDEINGDAITHSEVCVNGALIERKSVGRIL